MSAPRTTVTVDRIVLRGVDPRHADALAASLKSELARVLAEPRAVTGLSQSHQTPNLNLGRMPLAPGRAGVRAFGVGVARAIAKGAKR